MTRGSVLQTRLRRMGWWWHLNMGRLGVAALALLLTAAMLALWVRPALWKAQEVALRERALREQAQARLAHARLAAGQRDPREDWFDALPQDARRSDTVVRLLMLLHASRVADDTADYVAEEHEPGLLRVRVTVPLNGSYRDARKLLADVLDGLPNAALDALELEQQPGDKPALSGQMRLSLFFRRVAR